MALAIRLQVWFGEVAVTSVAAASASAPTAAAAAAAAAVAAAAAAASVNALYPFQTLWESKVNQSKAH